MKKILIILFLFCAKPAIQDVSAQHVSISFNTFYDELSPYGQWIDYPPYGNVWRYNQSGFRPYYNDGYWAFSNLGWTWVSNYSWGWAPFHYGRWVNTTRHGWLWVPGYEWAPAWVSWSSHNNYYGWAPLGPGYGLSSWHQIPANNWVFVQQQYINSPTIHNHYINHNQNTQIIREARPVENVQESQNVRYQAGPAIADVQQVVSTPIQPLVVNETVKPGKAVVRDRELNVYKPQVVDTKADVQPADKATPSQTLDNQPVRKPTQRQVQEDVNSETLSQENLKADADKISTDREAVRQQKLKERDEERLKAEAANKSRAEQQSRERQLQNERTKADKDARQQAELQQRNDQQQRRQQQLEVQQQRRQQQAEAQQQRRQQQREIQEQRRQQQMQQRELQRSRQNEVRQRNNSQPVIQQRSQAPVQQPVQRNTTRQRNAGVIEQ